MYLCLCTISFIFTCSIIAGLPLLLVYMRSISCIKRFRCSKFGAHIQATFDVRVTLVANEITNSDVLAAKPIIFPVFCAEELAL